jgi:hypothetical protein
MNTREAVFLISLIWFFGCSASTKETFHITNTAIGSHEGDVPELAGLSVDAKQRLIWGPKRHIMTLNKDGTQVIAERRIICAEPSPDALSALSANVSAQASLDIAGRGSGSGQFERSFAEAVQNIGKRTVTVQVLRDGLYRACEAYANGVLDEFGYGLILNQVDNIMVKLIALESLGQGVVAPDDRDALDKLRKAESDKAAVVRAEKEVAIANEQLKKIENQEHEAKRKVDAASRTLVSKQTEQRSVEDAIANEKKLISEDEAAAKTARDANKPAPAAKGSRANLRKLEERRIQLTADVASAEQAVNAARASLTKETERMSAIRSEVDKATAQAKRVIADAQQSEQVALGIERKFPSNTPSAIVATLNSGQSLSTITGACLMWFARNPTIKAVNRDSPAIAQYCNDVIKVTLKPK